MTAMLFSTASGYAKRAMDIGAYPREYRAHVEQYAGFYGVEPNLVYAIIKAESSFRPDVVSYAGAVGLMQIMPKTYKEDICFKIGRVSDPSLLYDPETNIQAGVWYVSRWYAYYGTAVEALAAYHAGIGNVNKWLEAGYVDEYGTLDIEQIPIQGTQNYVNTVLYYKSRYDELYGTVAESGKRIHENICREWALLYGNMYGIDFRLIMAIIRAESTFDPESLSSSGAKGLMQILRSTYTEDIKVHLSLEEDYEDLTNGKFNVMCGTYYLHWLSRYLTGTEQIVAAYNGGIGNVRRWLANESYSEDGVTLIVEKIPNATVRNYVNNVMEYYEEYCARYPE
jgi:soluble lytic murein transglycosylase